MLAVDTNDSVWVEGVTTSAIFGYIRGVIAAVA